MAMSYFVLYKTCQIIQDREELLSRAWGELPVSYSQDNEDMNLCTYLDVKVNKWELNKDWSRANVAEPWIFIEFLRENEIEKTLIELISLEEIGKVELLLKIQHDDFNDLVDQAIFDALLVAFAGKEQVYLHEKNQQSILEFKFNNDLHSIAELKEMLINGPA